MIGAQNKPQRRDERRDSAWRVFSAFIASRWLSSALSIWLRLRHAGYTAISFSSHPRYPRNPRSKQFVCVHRWLILFLLTGRYRPFLSVYIRVYPWFTHLTCHRIV